ncbi:transporter [Pseudomonas oryzihabitans]|uniref:transporter n=1 Tax=Pseudomonas oryzihabitans TaxID=47885 RepID=UPI00241D905E|nr:transporter [Pseudomonas oryzihabitans]
MRRTSLFQSLVAAFALAGLGAQLQAADLNARDFFSAPVGTSLGVGYLPLTRSNAYHGAGSDQNTQLEVNAFAYRQLWFSDLCGLLCTPQFIVPYADVAIRSPGALTTERGRGVGDPQVGGTLFFINDPEQRIYSGLLALLTLPLGEYDGERAGASPGANRWALHLNYNYTRGLGKRWVLEANVEAQLYAKNDDFYGQTLTQAPLYRLQAFASYDLSATTYGGLRLIHADGGELHLGGRTQDDTHQRYTQVGFEIGHWLDKRNQVLLGLTRNVATTNAFARDDLLLRFVHVF